MLSYQGLLMAISSTNERAERPLGAWDWEGQSTQPEEDQEDALECPNPSESKVARQA